MEAKIEDKIIVTNNQTVSIFELGWQASDILEKWQELNIQGIQVSLKEFPTIDFYQIVDDKPLMEHILEFAVLIEVNKKVLAKKRQAKGIAEARRKGIKLGRKEKKIPENFIEVYEQVSAKKITLKKATEILDVDYKTYRKWIKKYKEVE